MTSTLALVIPSLAGGGAERIASQLLESTSDFKRTALFFRDEVAYPCPARRVTLPFDPQTGPRPARPAKWAGNALAIRGFARANRVDVLVGFTSLPNVLVVGARSSARTVLTVHSHEHVDVRGTFAPVLRAAMRATYPRADHVVAVSEPLRDELTARWGVAPRRISVIPNSFDIDRLRALALEPGNEAMARWMGSRCVVTLGRLSAEKGHAHLVRAFATVAKRCADARLLLIGSGQLDQALLALAAELGLRTWAGDASRGHPGPEAQLAIAAFMTNPFPLVARARVFAFPSVSEGFGNVLVEALALGRAIFAADCPFGPREVLAPGTGRPKALIEAESCAFGTLLPVFERRLPNASETMSPAQNVWAEALAHELAITAPAQAPRIARAREFEWANAAPRWRAVLEGRAT